MKGFMAGSLSILMTGFVATSMVWAAEVDTPIARIVPAETSLPGADIPSDATHHLAVEVQGTNLSQLIIRFPADIKPPTAVQVTDQAGALVDTKVAINQQQAVISFVKPVLPHTTLKVDLKGVRRTTSENVVVYEVAARRTGVDGVIPIGAASVRSYGPAQQ